MIIAMAMFSCNNSENKTKSNTLENHYPAYIIKAFMDGCLENKPEPKVTQTLICSCLMEKIQSKYSIDEYLELSNEQHGSKWDEYQIFLNQAAADCISKSK